jgi:hypothetical protein
MNFEYRMKNNEFGRAGIKNMNRIGNQVPAFLLFTF